MRDGIGGRRFVLESCIFGAAIAAGWIVLIYMHLLAEMQETQLRHVSNRLIRGAMEERNVTPDLE